MLYRYSVSTVSYSSNDATATTTTSCDHYCECPQCGYRGTMSAANDYSFVSFEAEPLPRAVSFVFPRPRSDAKRAHAFVAPPIPFTRYRRALRHRGGFRNFHKIKD